MTHRFLDRRHELFGREPDVAHLLARCKHKGLTAITGRPRSGKSWLLVEVARRLQEMGYVVGRAESTGEQPDLLLRTVSDAYARWLAEATAAEQAESLYERHQGELVGMAGKAVGGILRSVGGAVGLKAAGELASKAFAGLAAADRDLKSGGIELPRLGYDQARDLVNVLARVSGKDVVLILDAWENTPAGAREAAMLSTYLGHLDEWPGGHLLLGVRVEGEGDEKVRDVRRLVTGSADASEYELGGMHLEKEAERRRLVLHVRSEVGAPVEGVDDETFLQWIDAYPGVVEWWGRPAVLERLTCGEDMATAAADAQAGRYFPELERLLRPLYSDQRELFTLTTRLALLPEFVDEAGWDALRFAALAGSDEPALADLQVLGILESPERYPSFGHSTRREAVAEWLFKEMSPLVRVEAEDLVQELAGRVRSVGEDETPFLAALVDLRSAVERCGCSRVARALTACAASLFSEHQDSFEPSLLEGAGRTIDQSGAPLLAMGLVNSLVFRSEEGDREGQQGSLAELRELADRYPQEAAVRGQLAMGLFNSLTRRWEEGDREGREAFLTDLRELADRYPRDGAVRRWLAWGLLNTLFARWQEGDLEGREVVLAELRELAGRYPDDGAIREQLAMGLFNSLVARSQEGDRQGREASLSELRELTGRFPDDGALTEWLAKGLVNSLVRRSAEGNVEGREALLIELRELAAGWPDEDAVREQLAKGLFNSLLDRSDEGDFEGRAVLLVELRDLTARYRRDGAVRERLARSLVECLVTPSQEEDRQGREALLAELEELAMEYPEDERVLEALWRGRSVWESDGGEESPAGGGAEV